MRKLLTAFILSAVLVMTMAFTALANENGASATASLSGNNANQGTLTITLTDGLGYEHVQVVQSPGNNTVVRGFEVSYGVYEVTVVISGNRISSAEITKSEVTDFCLRFGHTPGDEVIIDPTCDEDGRWEIRCEVCDELIEYGVIAALEHDFQFDSTVPFNVVLAANNFGPHAYTMGYDLYVCENCDETEQRNLVLTHEYTVDPNCSQQGYTATVILNEAGEVAWWGNAVYVDELGHDFQSIVWDGHGWFGSQCSRGCEGGWYISHDRCYFGHEETEIRQTATCTVGGWDQEVCIHCDEVIRDQVGWRGALGHDFNELYTVEATCTTGGYTRMECLRGCELPDSVAVQNWSPALGHDYVVVGDLSTTPWTLVRCSRCGDETHVANVVVSTTPSAWVRQVPGNTNFLNITVEEVFTSGALNSVVSEEIAIRNNASGTYNVGPYRVFVNTQGNDQIRQIWIEN